jgi:hypothetical protein
MNLINQMNRFKHEVRSIAHTIQHYPHLLFQTVPLLERTVWKLQCSLDDLEMAATFDGKSEIQPNTACYTKKTKAFNNNMSSLNLPKYQTDNSTDRRNSDSSSDTTQTSIHRLPRESGKRRRLEADEEQVYLIARNIHLSLHTLLINAK